MLPQGVIVHRPEPLTKGVAYAKFSVSLSFCKGSPGNIKFLKLFLLLSYDKGLDNWAILPIFG